MVRSLNSLFRRVPAWPIYIVSLAHVIWLFWSAQTGALGPEPIGALERALGEAGLQVFILMLTITPLRRFLGLNVIKYRRALGLTVFSYVTVHLAVWLFLDVQIWSQIIGDVLKRPYITVGMVSFALMIPLAVTSNTFSIRKLGAGAWNKLHKLTYGAVILAAAHNVMVQKVWESEALVYLILVLSLLALRIRLPRQLNSAISTK